MSDINKKVQIDVTANGQQAKQEFASTANAAKDMSSTIAKAGGAAADSIDKMGAGAGESAQKVDRASKSMIASIQRATAATQAGGQSTSAYFDAISKQRGLNSDALKPYIDQLRAAEAAQEAARSSLGRTGITAAQTAAALRGVPAQFTDIAVSLSSGQAPMTVLLQQGGQLKDMFGGVGNAAKALGGYVASLVTPFTVAAAAIGGVGYAAYAGSTEMDEFKKNLILTGNISGITADKFNAMAQSMANISGITRGAAAEALTAMAASGNIGADAIERLTRSAIQFEKAGGQAVADTVKQFEELGKSPLDASIKLSEKTHYLTLAVYEQIKSLQEQGKESEAAALAQKTWADALDQRTPQMVQNLGYIESAWKGVKDAVTGAWDAAKDIGREETAAEKMLRLQRTAGRSSMALEDPTRYFERDRLKAIKEAADSELKILVDASKKKQDIAKEDAAAAAKNKAQTAAAAKYDSLIDSQASKAVKQRKELQLLDADRAAGLVSEEKYQQAKAALAKKYEEKAKPNTQAARDEKVYENLLDGLKKQLGVAEKLSAVEKLNIELQEKKYAKLLPSQKENLRLVADQIDMQKRAEAEGKATLKWIEDGADSQKKALKSLSDELEKVTRDVATYGKSRSEVAAYELGLIDEQIAAEKALNEEIGVGSSELLRNLEKQRAKRQELLEQASKLDQLDAGKKAAEEAARAAQKVAAEWEKAIDRIDQAFHDAFVKGIDAASDSLDAFTDSLRTSLKAAVADGLYQLTMKPVVVGFMGALSGASSASQAVPQGGAAQSGLGIMSGLQTAWTGVTGGVSNAANSFAMSGFGQAAGLSTAPGMVSTETAIGTLQVQTAGGLTAAGSTFAAAAGPVLGALAATYAIAEMQKSGWGIDNDAKSGALAAVSVGTLGANVILDRLFGHNRNVSNDAQGITGTFDASGFTGQSFQEKSQKGGAFRSDKRWTDYGAIGADMDKALDSMLKQAVSGVQTIGKTLGVESSKAMEGFSHTFALQLSENGDMSKAGEKIAAELKKVQDELVTKLVPSIADFARYGESAADTFGRLNQEVTATDAILLAMGKNASEAFGAVGLASIKAREDLIDLAGGLDKLASKTQSYYQAYYSSNEQLQLSAKQAQQVLVTGFADIGQSIPASRAAFRSLVEAQDLSTESGRKLWNSLLDLSDEFDIVQKLSDTAAESLKTAKQSQATLFDTFASDAQKLDAARKIVNDTFASIGKAVPDSAASFLALAQSIDPATEAGQGLIAVLAKVSNAFAYTQTAAITAAEAATAAINKARNTSAQAFFQQIDFRSAADGYVNDGQAAIDKLFGNINAGAIESAQLAASAAADASQAWKSASQSIKSALDNIRTGSLSGLSPESRYRMLQSQFAATSSAAQSGDSEAAGKLGQIAADFLEASRDYNASSEAFQADRAAADTALSKSLSYASSQVSLQDTIAKASQASAAHLQSLNDTLTGFSAKALELLQKSYGGADRGTASNAVSALSSLQAVADKFFADTAAGFTQQYAGGTLMRLEGNNAQFTDADGKTSYVRAGESVLDIAKRVDALRDFWSKQFGISLPSYAVGTPFVPEDQIAQIHQGEMIIPASAAAQLRKYGIGSQPDNGLQAEILAELRTTRQSQQQSYGAMQQQLASSNAKLAAVERRLAAMEDQARLQRAGS